MKTLTILTLIGLYSSLGTAQAAEPKVATMCVGCHGEKGKSLNDLWPTLLARKKPI